MYTVSRGWHFILAGYHLLIGTLAESLSSTLFFYQFSIFLVAEVTGPVYSTIIALCSTSLLKEGSLGNVISFPYQLTESFCLSGYVVEEPLWWVFIYDTEIFRLCSHSFKSIHKHLWNSLSIYTWIHLNSSLPQLLFPHKGWLGTLPKTLLIGRISLYLHP